MVINIKEAQDARFALLTRVVDDLAAVVRTVVSLGQEFDGCAITETPEANEDIMGLVLGYLELKEGNGAIEVLGDGATERTCTWPATRYNRIQHALSPKDDDVCVCDGCITSCVNDGIAEAQSRVDQARVDLDEAQRHLDSIRNPNPVPESSLIVQAMNTRGWNAPRKGE